MNAAYEDKGVPMSGLSRLLLCSAALLAASGAVFAHHSYTRFDMNRAMTLEGTIKEYQWTNPHVWIQLVVKDPGTGVATEWSIESDSPNMLSRRGWTRHSVKVGDAAVAVIHPTKIKSDNSGALESLTVNGERIGDLKPQAQPQ
jgi:hypothetical protein